MVASENRIICSAYSSSGFLVYKKETNTIETLLAYSGYRMSIGKLNDDLFFTSSYSASPRGLVLYRPSDDYVEEIKDSSSSKLYTNMYAISQKYALPLRDNKFLLSSSSTQTSTAISGILFLNGNDLSIKYIAEGGYKFDILIPDGEDYIVRSSDPGNLRVYRINLESETSALISHGVEV